MDTANLSFVYAAASLFGSLTFAGIGLAIGHRLLPRHKAERKLAGNRSLSKSAERIFVVPSDGKLLPSEIVGLDGNLIRYCDGSYGKAYQFEPANTLYDDGLLTEQRIEELKTILKFDKPQNTIIQIRFENAMDDGDVLKDHLRTRNAERSDPVAGLLQATNLALYEEAIRSGQIIQQTATVWIRVPVRDANDKGLLAGVFPSIRREIAVCGFLRFLREPVVKTKNAGIDLLITRQLKAEKECKASYEECKQHA